MNLLKEETMATLWFLLCTIPLTAALNLNDMIGTGRWTILKTTNCPENEMYPMQYEVSRKKVNRTHDGFNLYATLESPLDESYGIFIDACKYMDGGCKPYQFFADDCACNFMEKYGGNNLKKVLTAVGVDPPQCPIPEGTYNVTDFVFNYNELPQRGLYGMYDATVYLLAPKNEDGVAKRKACMVVTVNFENDG